jgi:c(7)-type cytochrome triheme protein
MSHRFFLPRPTRSKLARLLSGLIYWLAVLICIPCSNRPGWATPRAGTSSINQKEMWRGQVVLGFEHLVHEQKVDVAGGQEIPCAACHPLNKGQPVQRPGHSVCFGACHQSAGPLFSTATDPASDVNRLCRNCHGDLSVGNKIEHDFGLLLSHQAHSATPCESCHRIPKSNRTSTRRELPHSRCLSCHLATMQSEPNMPTFAITQCRGCHSQAFGPVSKPAMVTGTFAVDTMFSHLVTAHRKAACDSCHRVASLASDVLPAPSMASCGSSGCHDGRNCFAVTEQCTRCHRAPTATVDVARPGRSFSHRQHQPLLSNPRCQSCHDQAAFTSGATPVPKHAACLPCHATDFANIAPVTCGACHIATEPWRKLAPIASSIETSQFGVAINHATHSQPCQQCHQRSTQQRQLRPLRGHATCAERNCHGQSAAPVITDCQGCHQLGLRALRLQRAQTSPWSTRSGFDHDRHSAKLGGAVATCAQCHSLELASPAAAVAANHTLPIVTKQLCARCHDGQQAFSVTSTQCKRCHQTSAVSQRMLGTGAE